MLADVGGDVGALVLYTPEALTGAEIEISPVGDDSHRAHTAVRERKLPGGSVWAAFYPSLPAGDYTLWDVQGHPATVVTIDGGHVAEVHWR